MKFLRDRSLKRLGIYFLTAMVLLLVAEYFVVQYKINAADEIEAKKDFTRHAQLESQQLTLQAQRFLNTKENLTGDITARIERQDHDLEEGNIRTKTCFGNL